MSLCINPRCRQPNHPENEVSSVCGSCGSELILAGRYRVMRLMSNQSGFGCVYEAYERNIPKILKVLKEVYNHNEKVLTLFQREAQVLGQLHHPGVPQVGSDGYFIYWPKDGIEPSHCLVMEKIDGPNLKQWMVQQGNHPISEKQALLWLTQLTDVLHLVHQENYFHRDIKPDNIMLRSSGQLVLVDFGAAREMTQTYMAQLGDSDITAVSSAGYTPPEQEQGQAVLQSDFYAMGRTAIYLLTAKMPNDPAIYNSRANAFQWRNQAPQISPALADLVDDLTAPAAADRPQTTEVILERLAQIKTGQTTPTPASSGHKINALAQWPETTLHPHDAQTVPEATRRFMPPWLDQRPWLLAGLTGLALALPLAWYGVTRGILSPLTTENTSNPTLQRLTVTAAAPPLSGHQADVLDLILLKDGNTLITSSADETIRVWDLDAGTEVRQLDGHTNVVKALALTPDQEVLISAGDDRSIRFWNLEDGKPIKTLENAHSGPITALEVTNNGKLLVSADSDGEIKLWNLADRDGNVDLQNLANPAPIRTLQADGTINDLRFTRDDSFLASGGKTLMLWDMNNLEAPTQLEGHKSFINRLDISADDRTLISASADKTIRLWDIASKSEQAILEGHQSYVNDLRVDGPRVWSSDENKTIFVWNLNQSTPMADIQGFSTDIWRFSVRPNGQIVVIGGNQNQINLWETDQNLEE